MKSNLLVYRKELLILKKLNYIRVKDSFLNYGHFIFKNIDNYISIRFNYGTPFISILTHNKEIINEQKIKTPQEFLQLIK